MILRQLTHDDLGCASSLVGDEHEPFEDGWELELVSVCIRALHTPSHRPEHTSFALIDSCSQRAAVGGAHR